MKQIFIQKERDKLIYYEQEFNGDGERIEQIRIEFKLDKLPPNAVSDKVLELLPTLMDGERIKLKTNDE